MKKGVTRQVSAEYFLLSVMVLPNLTECWVGRVGYWQGFYIFFFSLYIPLWTEARVLLGLALLCWRKIANPGYSDWTVKAGVLWKNCFAIHYLSLSSSPTLHYFPLAHCATLQLPFLVFSLAPFILCSHVLSLLILPSETPMVRQGYNVAFPVWAFSPLSLYPGL